MREIKKSPLKYFVKINLFYLNLLNKFAAIKNQSEDYFHDRITKGDRHHAGRLVNIKTSKPVNY